jgi:predicted DNA-binding protein YlxM (UPF0122 family)
MKDYLTVAELAKECNLSRQAVYVKLDKELKPFLKIIDNKKMVSSKALKILNVNSVNEIDKNIDETIDKKNEQFKMILTNTIDILTEQLLVKDRQIEQLNCQIQQSNEMNRELNERIKELTALQHNNQVIQLKLHEQHKPKLLERLFGNKKGKTE